MHRVFAWALAALGTQAFALQSTPRARPRWLKYEDAQVCESNLWAAKKPVRNLRDDSKGAPGNFYSLFEGNRNIYRGRSPSTPDNMSFLTKKGVSEVIIFKDWRTDEERQKLERRYMNAGFSRDDLHWIPFPWSKTTDYEKLCKESIEGLQIMKDTVEKSRQGATGNLYLHCTAGEDRTGFLSGLFRMVKTGWSLKDAYAKELCARGYADGNPKKPKPVAEEVHRTLSPLFEDMGKLIQSGDLSWANLDSKVCENLKTRRGQTTLPACKDLK